MSNDDVIRRGGGSPQARWASECCRDGSCPVCNPPKDDPIPIPCKACDEMIPPTDEKHWELGYCARCKEEIDAMEEAQGKEIDQATDTGMFEER